MTTAREDLEAVAADLLTADDKGDRVELARIAWSLLARAGVAAAEIDRLHAALWATAREYPPSAAQTLRTDRRWHVLVPRWTARALTHARAC